MSFRTFCAFGPKILFVTWVTAQCYLYESSYLQLLDNIICSNNDADDDEDDNGDGDDDGDWWLIGGEQSNSSVWTMIAFSVLMFMDCRAEISLGWRSCFKKFMAWVSWSLYR